MVIASQGLTTAMPVTVVVEVVALANSDPHDDALKRIMAMAMTQTVAVITKRTNRRQGQVVLLLLMKTLMSLTLLMMKIMMLLLMLSVVTFASGWG